MASFCYLVFLPGVFRLFDWRFFVDLSFPLASFHYFVFSPGVFSSFCADFFSLFRLFSYFAPKSSMEVH